MQTLPALGLATAGLLAGFVAWRVAGTTREPVTGRPPVVRAQAPPITVSTDPDVAAVQRALREADASSGPSQGQALGDAIRGLDALMAKHPLDPEFAFYRAITATMAADEPTARNLLAQVATLSPLKERDARVVYLKALVILAFEPEKPDPAVRMLRTLRAEVPTWMADPVRLALHRGLCQATVVRTEPTRADEAVKMAEEAVSLVRDDPRRLVETRRLLAKSYTRAARFPEAEEIWKDLVAGSGGRAVDDVAGLANTVSMQNRYEDAVTHFTEVIELLAAGAVPGDAGVQEARMRRGNCQKLLGHLEQARADLEGYLADHPRDHRAIYWVGMLWYDGYDDPARAEPYLERAYRMAPWCEAFGRTLLTLYEVRKPDAAKAAALRLELEANADDHAKTRERLEKESKDGIYLCR